ncbi:MAG: UDP-N-acetylglucosamine--LPS N-acetylglucosamine transferase [Coriobacteriaceae bacterium]|nr:UDP-N-acetylglucosamine--LPS N-acetylglucosamine transferase [Coriobacteriaceae bacterium]
MKTPSNIQLEKQVDGYSPDTGSEAVAAIEADKSQVERMDAPSVATAGESGTSHTILVMHSSVGSGHRSAADAIGQMLEKMRDEGTPAFPDGSPLPPDTKIMVLDSLDYGRIHFNGDHWASSFTGATRPWYDLTWRYTFTGRLLWGGGTGISTVMFPRFTTLVREVRPMAVIATHIMGANIAVGARMLTKQNFPIVSVPTDYETEGLWPHRFTDAFCVGTEYMAETLRARKIPEEKIRITGIPTRTDFLQEYDPVQAREEFGLPADKKIVLVLAGAKLPAPYRLFRERIDQTLPYLHQYAGMHFVIICGSDREYSAQVRGRVRELGLQNVTVIDYCDQMAKLMCTADLAICKAGGLTVTECLCTRTPMILVGRAYGQEKANVNMLTSNGAAMHVTTPRELRSRLDRFTANPRLLDSMLFNSNLLRKPNAAQDIIRVTLELVAQTPGAGTTHRWHRRLPELYLLSLSLGDRPAHIR